MAEARRPTILDVARTAGVSTATVSRVINGASTVDRALCARVTAAIRQTGYVPNAVGRSLRRGGTGMLAVVVPDAENPYFHQIISEVERIARAEKHTVTVAHTENDLDLERKCFKQLVSRQVAGVVLIPLDAKRTDLSPLTNAQVPLVLVDRWVDGAATDLVMTDNVDAGRQAAEHLAENGFERPIVIAGPADLATTEDRARGFRDEWGRRGIELEPDRILRGDLHLASARDLVAELLEEGRADCVYATNNRMSAGAFEAMRGRPDAPALLGTDDDLWTRLVTPSISVVKQPVKSTGRIAARLLGQRMHSPGEEPSTTLLRPRLVTRESTLPRLRE